MHKKNNTGQSTVEYVLLVAAVIGVMIIFLTNKNSGLQSQMSNTLNTSTGQVSVLGTRLNATTTFQTKGTDKVNPSDSGYPSVNTTQPDLSMK